EGLDTHVGQAGDSRHGIVGVQSRQYQVTRQRGLYGNLRGFQIADLPNHDDVWVLSKDGSQGSGEIQIDAWVDLCLPYTGQVVFDRVFNRQDIGRARIQPPQGCI